MEAVLPYSLQESTLGIIHNKFITGITVRTKYISCKNNVNNNEVSPASPNSNEEQFGGRSKNRITIK
jgi:hypothetical protein